MLRCPWCATGFSLGRARLKPVETGVIMIADLHVHTKLSSDSNVAPEQYLEFAQASGAGLGAICFTEHRLFPTDAEDRAAVRGTRRAISRSRSSRESKPTPISAICCCSASIDEVHAPIRSDGADAQERQPDRSDSSRRRRRDTGASVSRLRLRRAAGRAAGRHGAAIGAIEVLNGQNSIEENRTRGGRGAQARTDRGRRQRRAFRDCEMVSDRARRSSSATSKRSRRCAPKSAPDARGPTSFPAGLSRRPRSRRGFARLSNSLREAPDVLRDVPPRSTRSPALSGRSGVIGANPPSGLSAS